MVEDMDVNQEPLVPDYVHQAVMEFVSQARTSQTTTRVHQVIWRWRAESIGTNFVVSPCPYTTEQLQSWASAGRTVGFLPAELATRQTRSGLAAIFPTTRSWGLAPDNLVTNDADIHGWFDYEDSIDAPERDTDETTLSAALTASGRRLLTLNQYVSASQDSKLLTGRYLDERRTWSRVASRIDGRLIAVRFDGAEMAEGLGDEDPADGSLLLAYDVGAGDRGPVLGVRTSSIPAQEARTDDTGMPAPWSPWTWPASIDLDTEWRRIAARYVELGFPTELGLSTESYIDSLPRFANRPESYHGRLDVPLVVETRLTWKRQAVLAGIVLSAHSRDSTYQPADARSVLPELPYSTWVNSWGRRFRDPIAPGDARSQLADDEVGANLNDLVALLIAHPQLSESGRFLEAIGYLLPPMRIAGLTNPSDSDRTPCTYHWRGRTEIGANLHPIAYSMFRPLIRSVAINYRDAASNAH